MATISSTGIGSGLDVESLVTKLMAVEQQPVTQLKSAASVIQTKISAFGALQSAVSTFRDAALKLTQATTWGVTSATSADPASVKVATADGAVAGNYAVRVDSLATSQSVVSKTYGSSTDLVGEGTLHVEIGSLGQAGFAPQPNLAAMNISISPTDTLATVREKINAAGAGVSAVIVNDATGARLIISSTKPGASNAFRITADGDAGLADLTYDPDQASAMTQSQAPLDAKLNINGVDITSPSNTLTNTLNGMTISLLQPTTAAVQVSVQQDTTTVKTSIQGFVDAYNSLATLLAADTKYDASTKTAGTLQGDSTAVSMQRQLRNLLGNASSASSVFATVNSIGLTTQSNGTIKVDDSKLTASLSNLAEVKKMFSTINTADNAQAGIAQRLRAFGDAVLGSDGALTTRTTGLNTSLTSNQKRQDELNARLTLTEARLRAQYTSLDTSMSKLTALNTYITNQVAQWNKA
ncbi:MAG: flagellar filament capping protein FliD [Rhizobacter sp.]